MSTSSSVDRRRPPRERRGRCPGGACRWPSTTNSWVSPRVRMSRALRGAGLAQRLERDVAAGPVDQDVGPVRRELLDLGLDDRSHGMGSDELDERQRFVVGLGFLAPALAAVGLAPRRPTLAGRRLLGARPARRGRLLRSRLRRRGRLRRGPGAGGRRLLGAPALALRVGNGTTAGGAAHRRSGEEDPPHAGDVLAAEQATLVEEPLELAVELLERVVRQHDGVGSIGDLEDERVAPPDDAGRRRDDLARAGGLVVLVASRRLSMRCPNVASTMTVTLLGFELLRDRVDSIQQLLEARQRTAFGGDVRAVDDEVRRAHWRAQSTTAHHCHRWILRRRDRRAWRGTPSDMTITAALFDFGGVILSSPFEAFARYERGQRTAPPTSSAALNATNPDTNAWARMERNEVTIAEFCDAVRGRGQSCRPRARRRRGPGRPARRDPARDGRSAPALPRAAQDRVPHQQLRRARGRRRRGPHGPGELRGRDGRTSTSWSSRRRPAAASPTPGSTRSPAKNWASTRPRRCSSTTSAST